MAAGDLVGHGHIGGYIAGGDPDTYCPDLWRWLVAEHLVRWVLDVGCGEGQAVDFFHSVGATAIGVDGVEQDSPWIVQHDYTTGPLAGLAQYDLVWACEFVEHVDEAFVPNFLDSFAHAPLVMFSHALPGQPGWHHVNCRMAGYWIDRMQAIGYLIDLDLTDEARALCPPGNYFGRTGLAFRKAARPAGAGLEPNRSASP